MRRTCPDGEFNIENREKPTWSFSLSAGVFGSLWDVSGTFEQNGVEVVEFLEWQCVARGDAPRLLQFLRDGLSEKSRRLFAPYPYDLSDDALSSHLDLAIEDSITRQSLSLIVTAPPATASANGPNGSRGVGSCSSCTVPQRRVIAHAFLWAAQSQVPEVGIAVADAWQGRGLGKAVMAVLVGCARAVSRVGLELTTMQGNARAKAVYVACGFEELGFILNPLGCDVTAAFQGRAEPTGIAEEFQMLRILTDDQTISKQVLEEMAAKRQEAQRLFGHLKAC